VIFYNRNPEKKDFDYFINMGVSYQHLEEFEKSLEMYERARELNPDSPLDILSLLKYISNLEILKNLMNLLTSHLPK
jgi:tetratricopeptide (TPR) repeat protein